MEKLERETVKIINWYGFAIILDFGFRNAVFANLESSLKTVDRGKRSVKRTFGEFLSALVLNGVMGILAIGLRLA